LFAAKLTQWLVIKFCTQRCRILPTTTQHYHKNYPRGLLGWGCIFGVMHLLHLPNQTKIISHQFLSVMYVFVRHMYVKTVTT